MSSIYKAMHFDMDGVIANTEPFHIVAEQQTCRDFNFEIDPEQWGGFKGRTANDIFSYLITTYGDPSIHNPEQLISHKTDVFLEIISNELVAIEGVLEFIEWSRSAHDVVSLVTSSNKRVQQHITNAFGITSLFDLIITGDDIREGKPAPEPYLKALGGLGVRGIESVVIEDSKSGIISALSAGCDVLAVTTSHPNDELSSVNPTYIVDDYLTARNTLELL